MMKKFHYRYDKRHFYTQSVQTDPNKLLLTVDGKLAYWSAYEMAPTVSRVCEAHARSGLPKLLGHTVTIEEAKALIEMEANKQSQPQQESSLFDQTYQKGKAMEYKKQEFDPNAPGIIAHSRVQVLNSANWGDGNVPVFSVGIRINLSVMAGEPPWLRIHLSPDPFRVVKRTEQIVRLQHEQIWVEIASQELDALFAKAGLGAGE